MKTFFFFPGCAIAFSIYSTGKQTKNNVPVIYLNYSFRPLQQLSSVVAAAGQDTALKQKAVNSNPVTVSAPPVRYAGAPPKPTAQPSPVKKAPVKAVPPVKKTPAAVSTAAKDNPAVVKIAQTKATETANADDIKFKHPAKILSVKSVTQINNSPSEKVTAPVKIASQSTPTKDANKTGPTTGAKVTPTKSVSSKEITATKGVAATKTPAEKVSPGAKTPAEKVTLAAKAPAEKVCPLANSAQEVTPGNKSTETVTPATKTGEKDSPTAAKPAVNVTPVAAKTADKVTPVAAKMADKVTPAAKAAEKVTQETATKATPAAKSTPTKPEAKVDAKEMDVDKIKASEKTGIVKKEDPKPLKKLTPDYSQAMAEELELIMIKIWENLPKDTTSDAEKAAIETYRNDAGDELRNALELGVKQRLLNIHNELNIKVTLEERPSPKWLSTFKRKFRALSMHRVPGDKNSFVAEIGCFKDFDKLYSANRTKLGGMKVSLEPVYNFIREPNELRRLENLERKKTRHLTSSKKTATDRGSYNEDTGSVVDESMEEDESLDLFSMLEGGIVLDECMGSDDEE